MELIHVARNFVWSSVQCQEEFWKAFTASEDGCAQESLEDHLPSCTCWVVVVPEESLRWVATHAVQGLSVVANIHIAAQSSEEIRRTTRLQNCRKACKGNYHEVMLKSSAEIASLIASWYMLLSEMLMISWLQCGLQFLSANLEKGNELGSHQLALV